VRAGDLRALGWPPTGVPVDEWLVDEGLHRDLPGLAASRFAEWSATRPLAAGMPLEALRHELGLPEPVLREALANLTIHNGLVEDKSNSLPDKVSQAVAEIEARLTSNPFAAPESAELTELGLGPRELAAAERAGRLIRLTETVVLAGDAPARAAKILATLPATFTVSEARRALGTTRRVAVPLLEKLDTDGITHRNPDGTRALHHD
jgi:selenocysteine-specific elongation factor